MGEGGQAGDRRRDDSGEVLEVAEVKEAEGREPGERGGESTGHEGVSDEVIAVRIETRTGELDDAAGGRVAGDAGPRGATVKGASP